MKVDEVEEEAEKEEDELIDGEVTEEKTETKGPKEKTVWDWEKMNTSKPIWMRKYDPGNSETDCLLDINCICCVWEEGGFLTPIP